MSDDKKPTFDLDLIPGYVTTLPMLGNSPYGDCVPRENNVPPGSPSELLIVPEPPKMTDAFVLTDEMRERIRADYKALTGHDLPKPPKEHAAPSDGNLAPCRCSDPESHWRTKP